MSNMSYCRFENTLRDLEDCYNHMGKAENDDEITAQKKLIELCQTIAQEYG